MKDENALLREKWISYWRGHEVAWTARRTDYPPIPDALHDLRCGAQTRAGTPCKQKGLYGSGRCKLHGGLSTGPKTQDGKARSALNGKRRPAAEPLEVLKKPNSEDSAAMEIATLVFSNLNEKHIGAHVQKPPLPAAIPGTVRCLDCAHLSAAHTCMLRVANGIPMGAPRTCNHFSG